MPLWLDQWGVQLAQSVADVLSFALTVVMMRRVFQNLQAEEHAAMLLQHHRHPSLIWRKMSRKTRKPPDFPLYRRRFSGYNSLVAEIYRQGD